MRSITTSSGTEIVLDGDLLAILEAVYRELAARHGLDHTFEDKYAGDPPRPWLR